MDCPRCASKKTRVVDSRESLDGRSVRRRRECEGCVFRFTTFERIEDSLPMVVKKGGQRESFDRFKILSGLKKACEKRPVSVMQMEDIVKSIEATLLESNEKEVSSHFIGELVIERLHKVDQVAYVRFASVYREFSDVSEFMETLRALTASAPALQGLRNIQAGSTTAPQSETGKVISMARQRSSRGDASTKQQELFRAREAKHDEE